MDIAHWCRLVAGAQHSRHALLLRLRMFEFSRYTFYNTRLRSPLRGDRSFTRVSSIPDQHYCVGDVMKKFVLAATVASVLAASPAFAAEDAGFYVGPASATPRSIVRGFDGSEPVQGFAGKFMPWLPEASTSTAATRPSRGTQVTPASAVHGWRRHLPIGELHVFGSRLHLLGGDGANHEGQLGRPSADGRFAWAVGGTWTSEPGRASTRASIDSLVASRRELLEFLRLTCGSQYWRSCKPPRTAKRSLPTELS